MTCLCMHVLHVCVPGRAAAATGAVALPCIVLFHLLMRSWRRVNKAAAAAAPAAAAAKQREERPPPSVSLLSSPLIEHLTQRALCCRQRHKPGMQPSSLLLRNGWASKHCITQPFKWRQFSLPRFESTSGVPAGHFQAGICPSADARSVAWWPITTSSATRVMWSSSFS